ncbi:MAG: acyltransferase, partial [Erysipelotrichia bacterium]|nr:acyltransferase [Erysipelotrichia bacterium]
IEGLKIDFFGSGNTVEIEEGAVFRNTLLRLQNYCHIVIKKTRPVGIRNLFVDMSGSRNGMLNIGGGISIGKATFAMANEDSPTILIGEDCMISNDVVFRATDGHVVYDIDTYEYLNPAKPIIIHDHVWIGHTTTLLKGSEILSNSIVGACSVVTKKFTLENIAVGGNPAKIIKKRINWDRAFEWDAYKKYKN